MSQVQTIPIKLFRKSHADAVLVVCSLLLAGSFVTVGLRFYTRFFLIRNVGSDDYLVLAALVCIDSGLWTLVDNQAVFTAFALVLCVLVHDLSGQSALTTDQITVYSNVRFSNQRPL
jgi:hypothetical protein